MENQIKLTDAELQEVTSLSTKYSELTTQFGQIKLERIFLESQISQLVQLEASLTKEYLELRTKEESYIQEIQKKYGTGEIDIESGLFVPTKTSV